MSSRVATMAGLTGRQVLGDLRPAIPMALVFGGLGYAADHLWHALPITVDSPPGALEPALIAGTVALLAFLVVRGIDARRRRTEADYRLLFEHNLAGIVQARLDGTLLRCNEAFARLLGYASAEDVLKRSAWELYAAREDRGTMLERLRAAGGRLSNYEARVRRRDGSEGWVIQNLTLSTDAQGSELVESIVIDVSERRAAEERLRESEQGQRALVENAPFGAHVYELQLDGRLVLTGANRAADRILGFPNQRLVGRPIEEAFPALAGSTLADVYRRLALEGGTESIESYRYDDERVAGAFEVHAFQVGPRRTAVLFRDVTERKREDQVLAASERRFRALIEQSAEGVLLLSPDLRVSYASPGVERALGRAPQELLGNGFLECVAPEDANRVRAALCSGASRVAPDAMEQLGFRVRARDGSWRSVEGTGRDLLHEPSVGALVVNVRDVTGREALEDALRQSEARFRHLVQRVDAVVWEGDPGSCRFGFVSDRAESLLGFPAAAWLEPGFWPEHVHPEDRERVLRTRQARRAEDHELEYRLLAADGHVVWVRDTMRAEKGPAREPSRATGLIVDVTAEKKLEQGLLREARASEALASLSQRLVTATSIDEIAGTTLEVARTLTGSAFGYVGHIDPATGRMVSATLTREVWDGCAVAGKGLVLEDYRGLPGWVIENRRPLLTNAVDQDSRSTGVPSGHAPIRRFLSAPALLGDTLLGQIALANPDRDYDEHDLRAIERLASVLALGIRHAQAAEERERLQAALARAAEEWTRTFDALEPAIAILDGEGRVQRLNRSATEAARRSPSECVGRRVGELGMGEPWHTTGRMLEDLVEDRTSFRKVRDPITARWWDLAAIRLDGGAQDRRIILVAREITEVVALEEAVRQTERLAVLGAVTAGVAHEVRNPLFAISANVDALDVEMAGNADIAEMLGAIRQEVERLSRLMERLLDYGRPATGRLVATRLATCLESATRECGALATISGVSVETRNACPELELPLDRERIAGVLINLIQNAIQHSPRGGTVSVDVDELREESRRFVRCRIADCGPGFQDEDLPRLFEPFFTRRRGGTGLGLSIAHRIVDEHAGRIRAENGAAGGAVIVIDLPVQASSEMEARP